MNGVESFGDLIHKCTLELIYYADSMTGVSSPLQSVYIFTASQLTVYEAPQTSITIKKNKRRRFEFFTRDK